MLVEKYEWDSDLAQAFTDWLAPMLVFDTAERATAEECLLHPFLQDVWPANEAPPALGPRRSLVLNNELDSEELELEEELNDYDLNEDEMENNLLAMSNSLNILDGGHGPDPEDENGDCFGSTGLFTAM